MERKRENTKENTQPFPALIKDFYFYSIPLRYAALHSMLVKTHEMPRGIE